jgi:hypothetical protein
MLLLELLLRFSFSEANDVAMGISCQNIGALIMHQVALAGEWKCANGC